MSEMVKAKMIDGVLFIEAVKYQLTEAKYQALSAEHEELNNKYNELSTEIKVLRAIMDQLD